MVCLLRYVIRLINEYRSHGYNEIIQTALQILRL